MDRCRHPFPRHEDERRDRSGDAIAETVTEDPAKVNPNGGAIALGHPVGATGAILAIKTIYELRRSGGRYGLITMCIGGGQGIAMIVERL
ncbi:hypothetical protein [Xanthobacter autotrophicus]|uniref:hypothetical protein n=1 Tax=Xanthobacter autotrophicus TaxID=280 RepID=UPI001AEE76B3